MEHYELGTIFYHPGRIMLFMYIAAQDISRFGRITVCFNKINAPRRETRTD